MAKITIKSNGHYYEGTIVEMDATGLNLGGGTAPTEITVGDIRLFADPDDPSTIQLGNIKSDGTNNVDVSMYAPAQLTIFGDAGNDYSSGSFASGLSMGLGIFSITADNLVVNGATGADGSFTTADGKTVTVTKGLITSIE